MDSEKKPMDIERVDLARRYAAGIRGVVVPGGVGGMRLLIAELPDERARLRARVRVEAEDVGRAGVTKAHVTAWLGAHDWKRALNADSYKKNWSSWHWACLDQLHEAVRVIADEEGRPGLDILDEMAAMEVP